MKLNLILALIAGFLGGVLFSPYAPTVVHAQSPANSVPKLHLTDFTAQGQSLVLAADEIERNASAIQLRGNVEIQLPKITCDSQYSQERAHDANIMVVRADEADFLRQGDEFVPRGNVRVKIEKPK
jgi:hypothetical protein